MNDTTRLIIAFLLIMVVLFVWQLITPKRSLPPMTSVATKSETITPPQSLPTQIPKIEQSTTSIPETEVILENTQVKVVFSNIGASIKSAYLKKYQAELIPENSRVLQTQFINDSLTTNYAIIAQDDSSITFQGPVRKTFVLHSNYSLTMIIEKENLSTTPYKILYEPGLAFTEKKQTAKDEIRYFSLFYQDDKKVNKIAANKVKSIADKSIENIRWVALKSKYFATILSNPQNQATCRFQHLPDGRIGYSYEPTINASHKYTLYFGPIDYEILKSYRTNWETLTDLGWTKIFAIAILKVLKFLYSIFRNYGFAIIVFALIMKGIFFPLTRMTTKQMQQLQLLQPKIEELKKKYKDNPQALNQETMQLYRLYKINPFSGCLPLIFQLPIFWALYSVLQKTIELRGARFAFWLQDLSLKDPYYILPILMGISFLIQNFLTSADKRNIALLVFMPIFLTVIFLNFPSGLQLYWFIFNLLSIVESIIGRGGVKWQKQIKQQIITNQPVTKK